MAVAFLLSGAWTLVLAVVQLAPSQVANAVMGTTLFDNGAFWTLQKASDGLAAGAAALLAAFAVGYFSLVFLMMRMSGAFDGWRWRRFRHDGIRPSNDIIRQQVRICPSSRSPTKSSLELTKSPSSFGKRSWTSKWLAKGVALVVKSNETPAFALPKLLLQTTVLFKYLDEGFPETTIFFYVSLLVLNWMISTYCVLDHFVNPRVALVRIFYSFDLFFAVFAPLQTIVYAYCQFHFDSAEFATRVQALNPGNFDVMARLFADPSEVAHFRAAFRSLQLSSIWSLVVKVALNAYTISKWWHTIELLGKSRCQHRGETQPPHRQKADRVSRLVAVIFFIMGLALFIYTIVAVTSSSHICEHFVHCKVPSYRWNVGAQQCSCSVFVDRQTYVKTFDEWEHPVDTSANLAALAASGDLKVVQIVNRQLSTFPVELRRCKGLDQLILIYTKTRTIPDWSREFTNLEYLHIEGDFTPTQLEALPQGLFEDMPKLAFLHLGCLPRIPFVPDLDRLPQLQYLMLAMLHSVTAFPKFDKLTKLERLDVVDATHVATLPHIANLKNLKSLMISARNTMCCNGFMNGVCDLTDFSCRDRSAMGEARVDCVDERLSAHDRAVVDAVGFPVCHDMQFVDLEGERVTRESSDGACSGVMYKRCELHGTPGICYPTRMMAVTCETFPLYEALRRQQISRGIGAPCDPIIEAWLGCDAK